MKVKMDVGHLRPGMYVAELDRPWLETPFLFQGFVIENEDDLAQLREYCQYVFVDDLQSRQDREIQQAIRGAVGGVRSGRVAAVTVEFEEWQGAERLRETLKRLNQSVERTQARVESVLKDVRLGRAVQATQTREMVREMVESASRNPHTAQWMTLLQSENELIARHSMNVSVLAATFARFLGWSEELLNVVSEGGMLHDMGMARVPRVVLEKKGPLTAREFGIVRLHAGYASRMLAESGDYDPRVIEIVRHHHERLDGSGYPDGLAGDAIPPYVQLVGIVDVYESMTGEKPYERALSPSVALTRLHKRVGTHFDRGLVEQFIRCIGIYPLSSLVRLQNGALGIVVSSQQDNRLKPVLLMVRDPEGRELLPRRMVNLALMEGRPGWVIDSLLEPEAEGIDTRRILIEEFMLR